MKKNLIKYFDIICVSFAVSVFLAFLASFTMELYQDHTDHIPVSVLKRTYEDITNNGLQTQEKPLNVSEFPWDAQEFIHDYDPNQWGNPNNILILHKGANYYTAVFGDGKTALLKFWIKSRANKREGMFQSVRFEIPYRRKAFIAACFSIIGVLITLLVVKLYPKIKQ